MANYILVNDIDCSGTSSWNSGEGFEPLGNISTTYFGGSLDGRNHTITGLTINRPTRDYAGMFGNMYQAEVRNLKLIDTSVTAQSIAGMLAGSISDSVINHVTVKGQLSGQYSTGGLAGRTDAGSLITEIVLDAETSGGTTYNGGVIGVAGDVTMSGIYATVDVTGTGHGGAITAWAYADTTESLFSDIYVTGTVVVAGANTGGAGIVDTYGHGITFQRIAIDVKSGSRALYAMPSTINFPITISGVYYNADSANGYPSSCTPSGETDCQAINADGSNPNYFNNYTNYPVSAWDFTNVWEDDGGNLQLRDAAVDSLPAPSGPSNPNFTVVTPGENNISVEWEAPGIDYWGGDPLLGYKLSYSVAGQNNWTTFDLPMSTTTYDITSLDPGGVYDLKIETFNENGTGSLGLASNVAIANPNISNCTDLQSIASNPGGDFQLTQDIYCYGTWDANSPDYEQLLHGGEGFDPIDDFTGSLDGNGYTIYEMTINRPGEPFQGIFAEMYSGAYVHDLNIDGVDVTGLFAVGGLVGSISGDVDIDNVNISGNVVGVDVVGMVAGGIDETNGSMPTISDVVVSGTVDAPEEIEDPTALGGIVGYITANTGSPIISLSTANVTIEHEGAVGVGGIVGQVDLYENSNLALNGVVSQGTLSGRGMVGGLVGQYFGTRDGAFPGVNIDRSESTATVTAGDFGMAGGFVGNFEVEYGSYLTVDESHYSGSVSASGSDGVGGIVGYAPQIAGGSIELRETYATGSVMNTAGNGAGGLVGWADVGSNIYDSYANAEVVGLGYAGGLIGGGPAVIGNSYAIGTVDSLSGPAGGIAGWIGQGRMNNSFAANPVSAVSGDAAGLVGSVGLAFDPEDSGNNYFDSFATGQVECYNDADQVAYSDETCQMVNLDNEGTPSDPDYFIANSTNQPMASWDFANTWGITTIDDYGYPVLLDNPEYQPVFEVIYNITNCLQLQNMRYDLDGDYTIANSFNCNDSNSFNDGDGFEPVGDSADPFTGSLDGAGFTIYGPSINREEDNIGLFGVTKNAVISNLKLFNEASVIGQDYVGIVAGQMLGGTLSNIELNEMALGERFVGGAVGVAVCEEPGELLIENVINYSNVYVLDHSAGGLVGEISNVDDDCSVTVRNTRNHGQVSHHWDGSTGAVVGGIVGGIQSDGGEISLEGVKNGGDIFGRYNAAGGIIGYQNTTDGSPIPEISRAVATGFYIELSGEGQGAGGIIGEVSGGARITESKVDSVDIYGAYNIGGLVGQLVGANSGVDIEKSYANASISPYDAQSGSANLGGLVGFAYQTTIDNSYATGYIDAAGAQNVAGLVGDMQGDITNSYAAGTAIGNTRVAGLAGNYESSTTVDQLGVRKNFASGYVSGNDVYQGGVFGYLNTLTAVIHENHYATDLTNQADCFTDAYGDPFDVAGVCEAHTEPDYFIDNNTNKPFAITEDGWDFDTVWTTAPNDYPRLRWDYTRPVSVITDCEQLQAMRWGLEGNYELGSSIDCSDTVNWNGGDGFIPVGNDDGGSFEGTFIGNGYSITGLHMHNYKDNTGLFGRTEDALITDFNLYGDITGADEETGAVIGYMDGGNLSDVTVGVTVAAQDINDSVGGVVGQASCQEQDGTLLIDNVVSQVDLTYDRDGWGYGGLVGYLENDSEDCVATVSNSAADGTITFVGGDEEGEAGGSDIGGLIGEVDNYDGRVFITDSHAEVVMENVEDDNGGLVGYVYNGDYDARGVLISRSSSNSAIISNDDADGLGGLVGEMYYGSIRDSYAQTDIFGGDELGGLVGEAYGDSGRHIERSYAVGSIMSIDGSPENIGGLVGGAFDMQIVDTFAEVDIQSDGEDIGGLVGEMRGDIVNSYASGSITMTNVNGNIGGLVGLYEGSDTDPQNGLLNNFSTSYLNFDHENMVSIGGIYGYYSAGIPSNIATNYFDEQLASTNACGFEYPIDPVFCNTASEETFKDNSIEPPFADDDGQNWDFENIWQIVEDDYPMLLLEGPAFEPVYEITTCEELQNINADLSGDYLLMNDIDCSESQDLNDGDGFGPIGRGDGIAFNGTLDGQGHNISQLYINRHSANNVGLFGQAEGATISRLTIDGLVVGGDATGAIVGMAYGDVTLDTVGNHMDIVANDRIGGLVGESENEVTLTNTYNQGNIEGGQYVGGLLGYTDDGANVYNSYNSGEIEGMGEVGGLSAKIEYGAVDSSFNAGRVQAGNDHSAIVDTVGEVYFTNNYVDDSRTGTDDCIGNVGAEACHVVNTNAEPDEDYFFNNHTNAPLDGWDFEEVWRSRRASFPTFGVQQVYTISNCEQLRDIEDDLNGHYELAGFIDCSDTVNWNGGEGWLGIGQDQDFTGTLDGKDATIGGLYLETGSEDPRGLFSNLSGEVRNLTIDGAHMANEGCLGVLAGETDGSDIYKVQTFGDINGQQVGGMVGCNYAASGKALILADSSFSGSIEGDRTGGIIGDNNTSGGATTELAKVSSDGTMVGATRCGGLVGALAHEWDGTAPRQAVSVDKSYSDMSISCYENVGGLIGSVYANGLDLTIAQSHFTGAIDNSDGNSAGGLVGVLEADGHSPFLAIEQSYVEGTIANGGYGAGGLVGIVGGGHSLYVGNAYVQADITFMGDNGGGLIGLADGQVELFRVYSAGSITNNSQIAEEYARWVGGLIGASEDTYITDSFTVMDVQGIESDPQSYSGLVGHTSPDQLVLNNVYYNQDTASGYCGYGDDDWIEDENCYGVSVDEDPEIYINNSDDAPLDTWNTFGDIWHLRANNYPSLSPAIEPQVMCEQSTSTISSVHVACQLYSVNNILYGSTTWEMRYHKLNTDDAWQPVDLPSQASFDTTITGLDASTWYDIQFRFTDDRGVSQWYRIEAETLGATAGSGSSSTPSIVTAASRVRRASTATTAPSIVADEQQKISLNDFQEYLTGVGKQLNLKVGQVVYFTVDGHEHSATVKEIGNGYIVLTLASTPFDVTLMVGQTGRYDVSGDNQSDVEIRYSGLQDGLANLSFRQLNAAAPVEASLNVQPVKAQSTNWWLWILVGIAGIAVLVVLRRRYDQSVDKR